MNSKIAIDISPEDLMIIKSILKKFIPNYEVWAFGSRVTGCARKFSDLDLVIIDKEKLSFDIYAALKEALSNSKLPFKVDLLKWTDIDEKFRQNIEQKYVVIQR